MTLLVKRDVKKVGINISLQNRKVTKFITLHKTCEVNDARVKTTPRGQLLSITREHVDKWTAKSRGQ